MAVLADKEQSLLGAIVRTAIAAARACLAGVVSIYLHAQRAGQDRLVVQEGVQFDKGPLGGMPVGTSLLLACLLAMFTFGPISNASQRFQANERMGVGVQNVLDFWCGWYSASTVSSAWPITIRRRVGGHVPFC